MSRHVVRSLATVASCGLLAAGILAFGDASPAGAASVPRDGLFHVSAPKRLVDTRGKAGAVGVNGVVSIPRSAFTSAGMPATGVQSVVVNVTVTGTTGPGYVVAYSGPSAPNVSTVNFPKGWTGAGMATVGVANSGGISVKVGGLKGTFTHVIVDLEGWYGTTAYAGKDGAGSGYSREIPERLFDSRSEGGALQPDYYQEVGVYYDPKYYSGYVPTAVLINLTATASSGPGNLAAWSGANPDATWPSTSSVNFAKGETSPNTAIVPLVNHGNGHYTFAVANTGRFPVQFITDLLGTFHSGNLASGTLKHVVVRPTRVMNLLSIATKATGTATVPSSLLDADRTAAFEGTVTAVSPTAASFETVWNGNGPVPTTSNLNVVPGQTRSNGFVTNWDDGGPRVAIYNNAGSIKGIIDVTGRFDWNGSLTSSAANTVPHAVATAHAPTRR